MNLNILCALHCEAKPLIDLFQLKKTEASPFPVYCGKEVNLGISGTGNLSAAACTAFLAGRYSSNAAWLNIGIGGHRSHSVGEAFLAHKVTDGTQTYYPSLVFPHSLKTETIKSVPHPENIYPEQVIYEMEAFGFFSSAVRMTTLETVHSIKVVSDNAQSPSHQLNKGLVEELIRSRMGEITALIDSLIRLQKEILEIYQEEEIGPYTERWHFSATQKEQLKALLRKRRVCRKEIPAIEPISSAKAFLEVLSDAF